MKKLIILLNLFFLAVVACAQVNDISGTWEGKLNVGVSLRIVFHFTKNGDDSFTGSLDSPDQGAKGIPCSNVTIAGDSVTVEVKAVKGIYKGVLINDSTITGEWQQGPGNYPLTVKHVARASVLTRPQTPKPPFSYNSEDVEYNNADNSIHFGATFTFPKTGGPFPTAMLITGSGQQDRDETILGHKPFAVIADYLTKKGYAVLRVDDRGRGQTTAGDLKNVNSADFAKDVEAGIAYLETRKEVDKNKIGLIGHSEGGLIESIVAAQNKHIDFIVMLAGPGIKGSVLLADQVHAILLSDGVSKAAADAYVPLYNAVLNAVMNTNDTSAAINNAMNTYHEWKKTTAENIQKELKLDDASQARKIFTSMIKQLSIPWFRFFLQTDPAEYIRKLQCKATM